ncbi:MAG: hypothetical protein QXU99_08285 [Candidatus Bathyarchaeia archaeon]
MFLLLSLSALVTATLWFFKPGDSDVWWYGAIAGFLGCLLLIFMVLIGLQPDGLECCGSRLFQADSAIFCGQCVEKSMTSSTRNVWFWKERSMAVSETTCTRQIHTNNRATYR